MARAIKQKNVGGDALQTQEVNTLDSLGDSTPVGAPDPNRISPEEHEVAAAIRHWSKSPDYPVIRM
jgi:hypothetical protein